MGNRPSKTREHILDIASRLFYQQGIRAIGVDTIVAEAHVAKMTLYNHFDSKDELIAAYLTRQHHYWLQWVEDHLHETDKDRSPSEQILAFFDVLENLLGDSSFRGCPFVNATAELLDKTHPGRHIIKTHIHKIHGIFSRLAQEAGCPSPDEAAYMLLFLIEGSVVMSLMSGDTVHARIAKKAAHHLLTASTT